MKNKIKDLKHGWKTISTGRKLFWSIVNPIIYLTIIITGVIFFCRHQETYGESKLTEFVVDGTTYHLYMKNEPNRLIDINWVGFMTATSSMYDMKKVNTVKHEVYARRGIPLSMYVSRTVNIDSLRCGLVDKFKGYVIERNVKDSLAKFNNTVNEIRKENELALLINEIKCDAKDN